MKHPRLAPFWAEAAGEEMDRLWRRGCFKTWKRFLRSSPSKHSWPHLDVNGRCHEPETALQIFISPPAGWEEDPDVVHEVLRPLYGIPSSARALHYTLGCQIVRDRAAGTIKLLQGQYILRILETHWMMDCNPVKTPLAPGVRLSRRDSPERNNGQGHHVEQAERQGRHQQPPRMDRQRHRRRSGQPPFATSFLRNLLRDFGEGQTTPTAIFEDNASCICMLENPRAFRRRCSSNT